MSATTIQNPPTTHAARKAEAVRYLKTLDHQFNVARTLPTAKCRYDRWEDIEKLADWAMEQSPAPDVPSPNQGVFLVVNEIDEQCFLDFANGRGDGKTIADRHISRRTEFYIDVDPTRRHTEGGKVCATDEERAWAEAALETVIMIAALHGFPEPLAVDTGNGYQIYYRVDLPNDADTKALISQVLKAFASLVDGDRGHIDTSVCNAARLGRVPGTYNRKGEHTPERPHRLANIVLLPATGALALADRLVLQGFVASIATRQSHGEATAPKPKTAPGGPALDDETFEKLTGNVHEFLRLAGAPPVKSIRRHDDNTILEFSHCPFRGQQHEDGGAAVLIWRDGGIGLQCFHDKCKEQNWDTLQSLLGAQFQSGALLEYAAANGKKIRRRYNDPLVLAQTHYDQCRLPDAAPSLVFVHGDMHRYVLDAGWRPISSRELHAPVRETIQRAYDAEFLTKPKRKFSTAVTTAAINNTVKALEQITYFQIDPAISPPFWLSNAYASNPLDLLILRNGILDVRAWAEGRDHFFPRTSQLFAEAVGAYEFDPTRIAAPTWFEFLGSLDQEPQWWDLLQQIMGCCLCAGYDPQKLFMFVGPPRCGKGTITRVMEGILGGQNVCSPNLIDFASTFGLEQALGKRLAIVPEAAFPSKETQQIVAALKAISGGDLITVNRKHIKNIPVRLNMKIMLVTNNFVALPDNSKALPSRLIPLRFTKSFVSKEDLTLGSKLRVELPAILNWALEGFRSLYQSHGLFTLPVSSRELMDQLLYESAPLQSFLENACILDPRKAVYKQSLYEHYQAWSRENDLEHKLLSKKDFNGDLQTAVPHILERRPKSRELWQPEYTVIATEFDDHIRGDRPPVWVGLYCRTRESAPQ